MANLFISYARDDEPAAERLEHALEQAGHDVWSDRRLSCGTEYSREIERALERSDKVLVLWSEHSARSPWVRDEAQSARDMGKLVPLSLDGLPPPLGFRQFHTIDLRDWLRAPGSPSPPELAGSIERTPPDQTPRRQRIAFCETDDGVTLAYSKVGEGPPLVKVANWLNHLEFELGNPLWQHWIDELSERHMLLRYDERGNGISDWKLPALSFDLLVKDLETVVDAAGLDRFDLIGLSQGCPVGIAFAVRNPHRVRKLVLINGYAIGWRGARDPAVVETWSALATLAKNGWGQDHSGFRQTFTSLFFPDATPDQAHWWNELQKLSASPANAERFIRLFGDIDVSDQLAQVSVPTLVMHCRHDRLIPLEAGRVLASRIPGAEFVVLESRNHIVLPHEPAWQKVKQELDQFLTPDGE